MKKGLRLALSILMAVAMLATALPITVFAAEPACKIGDTPYDTLAAAIEAAESGAVINVTSDIELTSAVSINKSVTITSSNGSTISYTGATSNECIKITNSSTVNFAGNLKIRSTMGGAIFISGAAKVNIIDNVDIEGDWNIVYLNAAGAVVTVKDNVKIHVRNKGCIYTGKAGVTINIEGGTLTAAVGDVVRDCVDGNVINMSGGTLSAPVRAFGAYGESNYPVSNITITGGSVIATAGLAMNVGGNVTVKGNAIVKGTANTIYQGKAGPSKIIVDENAQVIATDIGAIYLAADSANASVEVKGGTVSATNGRAIRKAVSNAIVTVSGGKVTSATETIGGWGAGAANGIYGTLNITGGIVEATGNCAVALGQANATISGDAVITAASNTIWLNKDRTTNLNINGGTISATGATAIAVDYTRESGSAHNITVNGGTISAQSNTVNLGQKSTLTVNNGTISSHSAMVVANQGANAATIINGGTLIQYADDKTADTAVVKYGDSSTTTINGGLLINLGKGSIGRSNDVYTGGKFMYTDLLGKVGSGNIQNVPMSAQAAYDFNGNGQIDDGETLYIYNRFAGSEENAGELVAGAAVRLVKNSNGLKYTTEFSAETVAGFGDKEVTYGTIIVPTAYLTSLKEFTVEALTAKYGADGFINLQSENGAGLTVNDDGSVTLEAAIVNILTENYETSFSAVSYVIIDGEYYYTAYDQTANARTIKEIATEALADTTKTYTADELTVLNGYIGDND